jgi:hypothetical protein
MRNEWLYHFAVTATEPIGYPIIEDLMLGAIVPWAEARGLGIGGGFRASSGYEAPSDRLWQFRFGLCVQRSGALIPEEQAGELYELICGWCRARGLRVSGRYREPTPKDRGLPQGGSRRQ